MATPPVRAACAVMKLKRKGAPSLRHAAAQGECEYASRRQPLLTWWAEHFQYGPSFRGKRGFPLTVAGLCVASRFAFFNGKMLYIQPLNPGQAGGGGGGGGTGRRCGFQLRLSLLQWGGRRP